jgi:hypothetical protein
MQHAFGESDKNIIPILTWNNPGEQYILREVDLELPRKKIIYSDVVSMEEFKIPETEDKVKITLSGNYEEFKAFKKSKKYKEIIKTGTKVVFKPKKIKQDDELKTIAEPVDETNFISILSSLVNTEKNSFLYQVYELVVNNNQISEDDVAFL